MNYSSTTCLLLAATGLFAQTKETCDFIKDAEARKACIVNLERAGAKLPDKRPVGPNPCQFLTDAELKSATGVTAIGKLHRGSGKFEPDSCKWDAAGAQVSLTMTTIEDSVEEDVRGLLAGFTDPLNRTAESRCRIETLKNTGAKAAAVAEAADRPHGIPGDFSYAVVEGAKHRVYLFIKLPGTFDRGARLKMFADMARAAAPRL